MAEGVQELASGLMGGPHFKVATGAITWAFCWGEPASKIRLAPRPGHRHVS